jgi:NAD(P)-dependent dehydrogenase (short-subunit alcohol dehydrogenase family)
MTSPGQAAFVTGASSGMGLATARAFAASGAAVALADINQDAVNAAAKQLADDGHQVLALVCDVTDEDQVAAAVDRTACAPRGLQDWGEVASESACWVWTGGCS